MSICDICHGSYTRVNRHKLVVHGVNVPSKWGRKKKIVSQDVYRAHQREWTRRHRIGLVDDLSQHEPQRPPSPSHSHPHLDMHAIQDETITSLVSPSNAIFTRYISPPLSPQLPHLSNHQNEIENVPVLEIATALTEYKDLCLGQWQGTEWLGSTNMSSFLGRLQFGLNQKSKSVLVVSTDKRLPVDLLGSHANPNVVQRLKRKLLGDRNYDLFLFSVFGSNHWQTLMIDTCARTITEFCSLGRKVVDVAQCVKFVEFACERRFDFGKVEPSSNPKQKNSSDCGVFSLLTMYCLAQDLPLHFDQSDMTMARMWMHRVVSEKLDPVGFSFAQFRNRRTTFGNVEDTSRIENEATKIIQGTSISECTENFLSRFLPSPKIVYEAMVGGPKHALHLEDCQTLEEYLRMFAWEWKGERPWLIRCSDLDQLYHGRRGIQFWNYLNYTQKDIQYAYDIDSVVYTTTDVPRLRQTLSVMFLSNRLKNLQKHNHEYFQMGKELTKLHRIPHYQFGSCGLFDVLIFFPNLSGHKKNQRSSYIEDLHLDHVYDNMFRPALCDAYPADVVQHFPLTFALLKKMSKTPTGTYAYQSYLLPSDHDRMDRFFDSFRLRAQYPYNAFFFHFVAKNLKVATKSANPMDMKRTFETIITNTFMDFTEDMRSNMKVDIGVEFVSGKPASTVLWNRAYVLRLLECSGVNPHSKMSSVDHWFHTHDICGGSGEVNKSVKSGISYVQLYNSDKEAVFSMLGPPLKRIGFMDCILGNDAYRCTTDTVKLAFSSSYNASYGCRYESRVRLALLPIACELVGEKARLVVSRKPFVIIPSRTVAMFKMGRLYAYTRFFNTINSAGWAITRKIEIRCFLYLLFLLLRTLTTSLVSNIRSSKIRSIFLDENEDEFLEMNERSSLGILTSIRDLNLISFDPVQVNYANLRLSDKITTILNELGPVILREGMQDATSDLDNPLSERFFKLTHYLDSGLGDARLDARNVHSIASSLMALFRLEMVTKLPKKFKLDTEKLLKVEKDFDITPFVSYRLLDPNFLRLSAADGDRFCLYFPDHIINDVDDDDNFYSSQVWKRLKYLEYYQLFRLAFVDNIHMLDYLLHAEFDKLRYLPASSKDRLWGSRELQLLLIDTGKDEDPISAAPQVFVPDFGFPTVKKISRSVHLETFRKPSDTRDTTSKRIGDKMSKRIKSTGDAKKRVGRRKHAKPHFGKK